MSYTINTYLTDSVKIKQLFGSKNQELFQEILNTYAEDFEELDDYFEDDYENGANAKEILLDFINGEIRFPNLDFLYGYVFEKLVDFHGELVIPPSEEYDVNYYWNIEKTQTAFIDFPFSEDFPELYCISKVDLNKQKELFLRTSMDNSEEDWTAEKKDFEFIFTKAIAENMDLVFITY